MTYDERLPWFQCFPSKWLNGLAGLSPDQKLVYFIVLLRIYDVRGACPDSIEAIATRCGINKRRTLEALNALFKAKKLVREGDGIHNPFAVEVIERGAAIHRERASAGRRGGNRTAEIRKEKQSTINSKATAKAKHLEEEEESLRPNGLRASGGDLFGSETVDGHPLDPEADLFRRAKQVLGEGAGGMIRKLIAAKGGNVALARAAIEAASTKGSPRDYVGAMIRSKGTTNLRDRYISEIMEERNGTAANTKDHEPTVSAEDRSRARGTDEDHRRLPAR